MNRLESQGEVIIRKFCAVWEHGNVDAILAMMDPAIRYQNVPGPIMVGHEAVRAFIAPLVETADLIEFIVTALGVSDDRNTVLTERIDRLHYGEKVVELPLMGIFVVSGDLITEWRDYGDSALFAEQFRKLKG